MCTCNSTNVATTFVILTCFLYATTGSDSFAAFYTSPPRTQSLPASSCCALQAVDGSACMNGTLAVGSHLLGWGGVFAIFNFANSSTEIVVEVPPQDPSVFSWKPAPAARVEYKKLNCAAQVGQCHTGSGIPNGTVIKFRGPVGSSTSLDLSVDNLKELFDPDRMAFASSGDALESLDLDGCLRPGQNVSKILATVSPIYVNLRNNSLIGEITKANAMAFNPKMKFFDLSVRLFVDLLSHPYCSSSPRPSLSISAQCHHR